MEIVSSSFGGMAFAGMDATRVAAILKALAAGVDPHSGSRLDGTFQHADTVRALVAAVALIEQAAPAPAPAPAFMVAPAIHVPAEPVPLAPAAPVESIVPVQSAAPVPPVKATAKKAARATPGNAGKPWSSEEDAQLLAAFDGGEPLEAIAASHSRSRVAIQARLARFGRMPMPEGVRRRVAATAGTPGTAEAPSIAPPPVAGEAARPRYHAH